MIVRESFLSEKRVVQVYRLRLLDHNHGKIRITDAQP